MFEDELDPVPVLEEPLGCDKDKAVKNISQKNSNVHSVPSTSTTEKYSSPDSPARKKLKTSNELKCDLDSCDKDSLQSDIVGKYISSSLYGSGVFFEFIVTKMNPKIVIEILGKTMF